MRVLHWVLVPIAGVISWLVAFVFGLAALWVVDTICPASWQDRVLDVLVTTFSGVSAVFVVLGSAIVAPSHRRWVGLAAFFVGACFATCLLVDYWADRREYVAAIVAGFAAVLLAFRIWRREDSPAGNPAPGGETTDAALR